MSCDVPVEVITKCRRRGFHAHIALHRSGALRGSAVTHHITQGPRKFKSTRVHEHNAAHHITSLQSSAVIRGPFHCSGQCGSYHVCLTVHAICDRPRRLHARHDTARHMTSYHITSHTTKSGNTHVDKAHHITAQHIALHYITAQHITSNRSARSIRE